MKIQSVEEYLKAKESEKKEKIKRIISAQLWYVNDTVYLRAYSQTTAGSRLADNPIYTVTAYRMDDLGAVILKTLKDCKMGIPYPDYRQKQPPDEMLKATKLRSQKALMQKGKSLTVYLKGDQLEINPWYFDGKYLQSPKDRDMYCSLDSADITKTVLAAFEQCHP